MLGVQLLEALSALNGGTKVHAEHATPRDVPTGRVRDEPAAVTDVRDRRGLPPRRQRGWDGAEGFFALPDQLR